MLYSSWCLLSYLILNYLWCIESEEMIFVCNEVERMWNKDILAYFKV
jgi:hypothetical protein